MCHRKKCRPSSDTALERQHISLDFTIFYDIQSKCSGLQTMLIYSIFLCCKSQYNIINGRDVNLALKELRIGHTRTIGLVSEIQNIKWIIYVSLSLNDCPCNPEYCDKENAYLLGCDFQTAVYEAQFQQLVQLLKAQVINYLNGGNLNKER